LTIDSDYHAVRIESILLSNYLLNN